MLLPKLFTTHHTDLLPCFKMFSNFYSFTISCTYVVVKCLCPAARHAGNELQTTLSPSLSFIRLFYRPSQQLWQLQPWSSLACFHYILCKLWHLISLREMGFERWGTRVAKPSSPRCLIYCTCSGCEKCFCPASPLRCLVSLSLCGRQMWACVFIYLFRRPFGLEDFLSPAELHDDTKTVTRLICDHVGSPLLVLLLWAEETHIKHNKSTFLRCQITFELRVYVNTGGGRWWSYSREDYQACDSSLRPDPISRFYPHPAYLSEPLAFKNTVTRSSAWNLPLWNVTTSQPLHILSRRRRGFTLQPDISNMASILVLSKGQFAVYMMLYEKHSCSQFHAINPVIKLRKSSLLPAANLRDAL